MECLTNEKIQDYIDGHLNSVEMAMVRDHLISCTTCKKEYEYYETLEKQLLQPVEILPPPIIERRVLREYFRSFLLILLFLPLWRPAFSSWPPVFIFISILPIIALSRHYNLLPIILPIGWPPS